MNPDVYTIDTDPLRLFTDVDLAYLQRVESETCDVVYERLLAAHACRRNFPAWRGLQAKVAENCGVVCTVLGLVGMAVCLMPGWHAGGVPMRQMLPVLFLAGMATGWLTQAHWLSPQHAGSRGWPAYWRWLAGVRARAILARARAELPFRVCYTFDRGAVTCARQQDGRAWPSWRKELSGCRVDGQWCTLLFRDSDAVVPYCVIIHPQSAVLPAYLSLRGVYAAARAPAPSARGDAA